MESFLILTDSFDDFLDMLDSDSLIESTSDDSCEIEDIVSADDVGMEGGWWKMGSSRRCLSMVMEGECIATWLTSDVGDVYVCSRIGHTILHECHSYERDRSDEVVVSIGIDRPTDTTEIDQDLTLCSDRISERSEKIDMLIIESREKSILMIYYVTDDFRLADGVGSHFTDK